MFSKIKSKVFLPLFAIAASFSGNSYALSSCPNVQVGVNANTSGPAVYSDCTMDTGGATEFWLILEATTGGVQISVNGYPNAMSSYTPPPVGMAPFGTWDGTTIYVADMGPSYTGNCTETTTGAYFFTTAVVGNTYCGVIGNTAGRKVWLRGTWTGTTFTTPSVLTDEPSVGAAATPVPTLPFTGLVILGALLGAAGMRRLKA